MSSKCQTLIRHFETERNGISIYNTFHDEAVDIVLSFLSRGQPVDKQTTSGKIKSNRKRADKWTPELSLPFVCKYS
jgi:hypothetical protein